MRQSKRKKQDKYLKRIKVLKFKKELGFKTTAQRSKIMKSIRSSQTKPELNLRKALSTVGIRYRMNVKKLKGSPDIVIKKSKVAIFVDGEFWHGYKWDEKRKKIKSNRKFWIPKIERNMQRDKEVNRELKKQGWKVIRIWEHQIKKDLNKSIQRIISCI